MFFNLLFALHILICIFMVMLVLLQQGKGADAGAIMGSSSNSDSLFGALGSGTPVSKLTTWLAISFMITSIFLVKIYNSESTRQSVTGSQAPADVLEGSNFAGEEPAAEAAANSGTVAVDSPTVNADVVQPIEDAAKVEAEKEAPIANTDSAEKTAKE